MLSTLFCKIGATNKQSSASTKHKKETIQFALDEESFQRVDGLFFIIHVHNTHCRTYSLCNNSPSIAPPPCNWGRLKFLCSRIVGTRSTPFLSPLSPFESFPFEDFKVKLHPTTFKWPKGLEIRDVDSTHRQRASGTRRTIANSCMQQMDKAVANVKR